ncbi:GATA-binding factor 6-B [Dictyocoela muelleri]|nr:GATA-binding factor 6-B [Dictyocoela muelleri]
MSHTHSDRKIHDSKNKSSKKEPRTRELLRICNNCKTTNTPTWRRGFRRENLCNACGLYLKIKNVPRPIPSYYNGRHVSSYNSPICGNCGIRESEVWRDYCGVSFCKNCAYSCKKGDFNVQKFSDYFNNQIYEPRQDSFYDEMMDKDNQDFAENDLYQKEVGLNCDYKNNQYLNDQYINQVDNQYINQVDNQVDEINISQLRNSQLDQMTQSFENLKYSEFNTNFFKEIKVSDCENKKDNSKIDNDGNINFKLDHKINNSNQQNDVYYNYQYNDYYSDHEYQDSQFNNLWNDKYDQNINFNSKSLYFTENNLTDLNNIAHFRSEEDFKEDYEKTDPNLNSRKSRDDEKTLYPYFSQESRNILLKYAEKNKNTTNRINGCARVWQFFEDDGR